MKTAHVGGFFLSITHGILLHQKNLGLPRFLIVSSKPSRHANGLLLRLEAAVGACFHHFLHRIANVLRIGFEGLRHIFATMNEHVHIQAI